MGGGVVRLEQAGGGGEKRRLGFWGEQETGRGSMHHALYSRAWCVVFLFCVALWLVLSNACNVVLHRWWWTAR